MLRIFLHYRLIKQSLRICALGLVGLLLAGLPLFAQCPDTGATTVIQPHQGTGFYFFKFLGNSSYVYFLDGKKFSMNSTDDPGRTFLFIDGFAFEPDFFPRAGLQGSFNESSELETLRAQARSEQEHFKKLVPGIIITDYGASVRKNGDGSDGRLFYLWKKENPPGQPVAVQYLCTTVLKTGIVVLSIFPATAGTTEEQIQQQIENYTESFRLLGPAECARVQAAPKGAAR